MIEGFAIFFAVWLGGYALTLIGWKLWDNRIFNRDWWYESSVEGSMLLWWPLYAMLLLVWVPISLLIAGVAFAAYRLQKAAAEKDTL